MLFAVVFQLRVGEFSASIRVDDSRIISKALSFNIKESGEYLENIRLGRNRNG